MQGSEKINRALDMPVRLRRTGISLMSVLKQNIYLSFTSKLLPMIYDIAN
jgi:hypothetical protein